MRSIAEGLLLLSAFSFLVHFSNGTQTPDGVPAPTVIFPGQSIGPLRLGDSRERVFELFPKKPNMDEEWQEGANCGTTVNWIDIKMAGNLFIRLKENKVFQIDSATTSFHTAKGITLKSSPGEIREKYAGLRAYVLSRGTSEAAGGRPLVYWIDSEKGIAFAFARGRRDQRHYLGGIIVFRPHMDVCPQYPPLETSDRRELPPYSLNAE